METNHKRNRGFIKDKLVTALHQAAKPASSSFQYSSQVTHSSQSSSAATVGLYADAFVVQPPKQKLSYVTSDLGNYDSIGHVQNLYSYDQSIDDRAASYILSVQERFRLERVD